MNRKHCARKIGERDTIGGDWEGECEEFAERIRYKEEYEGDNSRRWVAEVEEDVESATRVVRIIFQRLHDLDTNLLIVHSKSPTNHIRIVIAGISGSSIFETDALTSGNGESSSSIASKSNSILERDESVHVNAIGGLERVEVDDAIANSKRIGQTKEREIKVQNKYEGERRSLFLHRRKMQ